MSLSLRLVESPGAIDTAIRRAFAQQLNIKMRLISKKLEGMAMKSVAMWIQSQPEMLSLVGGSRSLAAHFGLPQGSGAAAVQAIIGSVMMSTTVEFRPITPSLTGGIDLNFQPNDFKNLLGLPEGFVREYPEGHWLNMLLNMGMSTIITGYRYKPGFGGRSGGGIMTPGSSWRVPPQYAGTSGNNFVTRAFMGREKEITSLFQRVFAMV